MRSALMLLGAALIMACIHQLMVSRLDGMTSGTVMGLERDPYSEWKDNNYLVFYQFMTITKHGQNGVYLLENPGSLGEMPRMGTYMQVQYSTLDPTVNRPWSQEDIDYDQVFSAGFLLVIAVVMILAGSRIT